MCFKKVVVLIGCCLIVVCNFVLFPTICNAGLFDDLKKVVDNITEIVPNKSNTNSSKTTLTQFKKGNVVHIKGTFLKVTDERHFSCPNTKHITIKINKPLVRRSGRVTFKSDYWIVDIWCCDSYYDFIKLNRNDSITLYGKAIGSPSTAPPRNDTAGKTYFVDSFIFKDWDKQFIANQKNKEEKRVAEEKIKEVQLAKEKEEKQRQLAKQRDEKLKLEKKHKMDMLKYSIGDVKYITGIVSKYDPNNNKITLTLPGPITRNGKIMNGVIATISGVPTIKYEISPSKNVDLKVKVKVISNHTKDKLYLDEFEFISWGNNFSSWLTKQKKKEHKENAQFRAKVLSDSEIAMFLVENITEDVNMRGFYYLTKYYVGTAGNKLVVLLFIATVNPEKELGMTAVSYDLSVGKKLIEGLEKSLTWEKIAKKEKVNVKKIVFQLPKGITCYFVSEKKGALCYLVFENKEKWGVKNKLRIGNKTYFNIVIPFHPLKMGVINPSRFTQKETVKAFLIGVTTGMETQKEVSKNVQKKEKLFK